MVNFGSTVDQWCRNDISLQVFRKMFQLFRITKEMGMYCPDNGHTPLTKCESVCFKSSFYHKFLALNDLYKQ